MRLICMTLIPEVEHCCQLAESSLLSNASWSKLQSVFDSRIWFGRIKRKSYWSAPPLSVLASSVQVQKLSSLGSCVPEIEVWTCIFWQGRLAPTMSQRTSSRAFHSYNSIPKCSSYQIAKYTASALSYISLSETPSSTHFC